MTPEQIEKERQAFEHYLKQDWAFSLHFNDGDFLRDGNDYISLQVDLMWKGWIAKEEREQKATERTEKQSESESK